MLLGPCARHQSQCAAPAECLRTGPVVDEFLYGHRGPLRTIGAAQSQLEVYEDGRIVRDFVYIDDVVDALLATVRGPAAQSRCLDIGSGIATSIHELAQKIATICGAPEPIVVPKFRDGDVRAASCTIEPAKNTSTGVPGGCLRTEYRALLDWIGGQPELHSEPTITRMYQVVLK